MVTTKQITGSLYGIQHSSETGSENLMQGIRFVSDDISFEDNNIPLRESDIQTIEGTTMYYPYYNETNLTVVPQKSTPDTSGVSDWEQLHEDVTVELLLANNSLFVRTIPEITAYSDSYIHIDGSVYEIKEILLYSDVGEDYAEDTFLEIPAERDAVRVQNVETGCVAPVSTSKLWDLVSGKSVPNGALKVSTEPWDSAESEIFE